VKLRWDLSADGDEVAALRALFDTCRRPPSTEVAPAR
jgi:hypothetical protein